MTISLENAKKLKSVAKKHGVKLPQPLKEYLYEPSFKDWHLDFFSIDKHRWDYPAYTCEELLEWLPKDVKIWKVGNSGIRKYAVKIDDSEWISGDTSADALCLLAIKLIEEGVIK